MAADEIHFVSDQEDEEKNKDIRREISVLVQHGSPFDLFSAIAMADEAQVARLLTENPVPGESHEPVSSAWPLCAVAITLSCQPPANWFTTPPRFNIGCPLPNGNVYKVLATNRCGTLNVAYP